MAAANNGAGGVAAATVPSTACRGWPRAARPSRPAPRRRRRPRRPGAGPPGTALRLLGEAVVPECGVGPPPADDGLPPRERWPPRRQPVGLPRHCSPVSRRQVPDVVAAPGAPRRRPASPRPRVHAPARPDAGERPPRPRDPRSDVVADRGVGVAGEHQHQRVRQREARVHLRRQGRPPQHDRVLDPPREAGEVDPDLLRHDHPAERPGPGPLRARRGTAGQRGPGDRETPGRRQDARRVEEVGARRRARPQQEGEPRQRRVARPRATG